MTCFSFNVKVEYLHMYDHQLTIKKVKQIVKKTLSSDSTGHGYWHSYRVAKSALSIGKKEKGDLQILELSAWLHDIAVPQGRKNHHLNGVKQAQKILSHLNVPTNIIIQVKNCVLKHRYSRKYQLNTIEEEIIQDADNLDALGAIIIPRIFAHCGVHQIPIYDPSIKPNEQQYLTTNKSTTGINHIYEKLFKIPQILNTKTAKHIAKHRVKFLKTFLTEYLAEFEGKK